MLSLTKIASPNCTLSLKVMLPEYFSSVKVSIFAKRFEIEMKSNAKIIFFEFFIFFPYSDFSASIMTICGFEIPLKVFFSML